MVTPKASPALLYRCFPKPNPSIILGWPHQTPTRKPKEKNDKKSILTGSAHKTCTASVRSAWGKAELKLVSDEYVPDPAVKCIYPGRRGAPSHCRTRLLLQKQPNSNLWSSGDQLGLMELPAPQGRYRTPALAGVTLHDPTVALLRRFSWVL